MAYYGGGGAPAGLQPAPGMAVPPQHHVPPPQVMTGAPGPAPPAPPVAPATVNGAVHPEDVMPQQQQQHMMPPAHMPMAPQHQVTTSFVCLYSQ